MVVTLYNHFCLEASWCYILVFKYWSPLLLLVFFFHFGGAETSVFDAFLLSLPELIDIALYPFPHLTAGFQFSWLWLNFWCFSSFYSDSCNIFYSPTISCFYFKELSLDVFWFHILEGSLMIAFIYLFGNHLHQCLVGLLCHLLLLSLLNISLLADWVLITRNLQVYYGNPRHPIF